MSEKYSRFIELLKSIFELDKSDLDFGIYRIINMRKKQIDAFLAETADSTERAGANPHIKPLHKYVTEILSVSATDDNKVKARIEEIESVAKQAGLLPEDLPNLKNEYVNLKEQLTKGVTLSALETDVYNALYHFFNRYYDEGDFISKRRYKEGVYAIPYEGEEVKLYWANHDQYYIKSSENFKDYSFKLENGNSVHFKLLDASTATANNKEDDKKKRVFMLFDAENQDFIEELSLEADNGQKELNIYFTYDVPKNADINYSTENLQKLKTCLETIEFRDWLPLLENISKDSKKPKLLLEKHLNTYIAKNSFDFFIHKDLKKFLEQELDFYIKSEIMHLDDIDTAEEQYVASYLSKVKAIKRVGRIIINFLAQIEDFQKKLWLKKKFIVESNYCITLDNIPEDLYAEIIENKAQHDEWIKLFAIDEIEGIMDEVGYTNPLTPKFLKDNPYLVLDTAFFSKEFKENLLATIDDLDEKTDGLLIHSENFQALNLLQEKYKEQVKCVYIDPPYNTNASKIIYKNGYEHSSWVSLIDSRLELARCLMYDKSVIEFAIDDYEFRYANTLMDKVFGVDNAISNIAIFTNPKGRDQDFIAQAHDYTIIYAKNKNTAETYNFLLSEEEMKKKFSKVKKGESVRELPLKRTGSGKFREDRPYMFFPFLFNLETSELSVLPFDEYKKIYDPKTKHFDDDFLEKIKLNYESKGYAFILPISQQGDFFRWRWGYDTCSIGCTSGALFVKKTKNAYSVYQYDIGDNEVTPKSLWIGEKYDASSKGTNLLENIIPNNPFDYPKSLYTVEDSIIVGASNADMVLDFFAGSGTTGHAVINLNREDQKNGLEGKRKYILVEMGEYFDTVTKPRIQKVIYSDEWKNGKPTSRKGSSHIMKYLRLESYEDTLNNIELDDSKNTTLLSYLKDEYLLKYMLHEESQETLLNFDIFKNPFDYSLKITEKNQSKKRNIDLCESFNYLIGLNVVREHATKYYNASPNPKGEYKGAVSLTTDKNGVYAFKMFEGNLRTGEKTLVIWRNLSDDLLADNAALDAFFLKNFINPLDREFDRIYINGDNNIENLKLDAEMWKVASIEIEMKKLMFE